MRRRGHAEALGIVVPEPSHSGGGAAGGAGRGGAGARTEAGNHRCDPGPRPARPWGRELLSLEESRHKLLSWTF